MKHAAQQMVLCCPGVKALPSFQDLVLVINTELPHLMDIGPGFVFLGGRWSRWCPSPNGLQDKASTFRLPLNALSDLVLAC